MSDQRKPPLCDQHPWNHIRHRCCCVFDHDSDEAGPIAECFYHEKIRAERDEATEYGTRMRRGWQRECEDTDLLLQGLGLCPSEYRSEGGSLLLGRISHKLKQRGGLS